MIKRAIFSVVPDRRQERFLAEVIGSWKAYAKRHALEVVLMRRSLSQGKHPYWDRWFSIQDGVDEVSKFDELLLLDNDVYINEQAPDIFSDWDSAKIGVVEESAQGPWDVSKIPAYYKSFHVDPSAALPQPNKVFNFGVCVLHRQNSHLFKALYEKWINRIRPRFTPDELRQKGVFFRYEADGPFLSYELQLQEMIQPLPNTFNFFLPAWLEQARIARLPFLLQAKALQKLSPVLPRTMLAASFRSARSAMERALQECHFLHIAGSKSPLWLLPN